MQIFERLRGLQDESLQGRIVEALDQGQEALAQIVLEREIENVTQAARTGSETQLQEAIEQAKEANVPIQKLENAMETLNQLTCARMRLDLQSALDSDDEAEIRGALKEARSVLSFEELEEANNKLETLLLLRELSEAQAVRRCLLLLTPIPVAVEVSCDMLNIGGAMVCVCVRFVVMPYFVMGTIRDCTPPS